MLISRQASCNNIQTFIATKTIIVPLTPSSLHPTSWLHPFVQGNCLLKDGWIAKCCNLFRGESPQATESTKKSQRIDGGWKGKMATPTQNNCK